jgi:hypothetical protein
MTNKSAPEEFPLDEIDLLVGWRAGKDEYLFTKAVAMVREWLLDTEEKDRLRDVLKEILAEVGPPAGNRPSISSALAADRQHRAWQIR